MLPNLGIDTCSFHVSGYVSHSTTWVGRAPRGLTVFRGFGLKAYFGCQKSFFRNFMILKFIGMPFFSGRTYVHRTSNADAASPRTRSIDGRSCIASGGLRVRNCDTTKTFWLVTLAHFSRKDLSDDRRRFLKERMRQLPTTFDLRPTDPEAFLRLKTAKPHYFLWVKSKGPVGKGSVFYSILFVRSFITFQAMKFDCITAWLLSFPTRAWSARRCCLIWLPVFGWEWL